MGTDGASVRLQWQIAAKQSMTAAGVFSTRSSHTGCPPAPGPTSSSLKPSTASIPASDQLKGEVAALAGKARTFSVPRAAQQPVAALDALRTHEGQPGCVDAGRPDSSHGRWQPESGARHYACAIGCQ